MSLVITSNVALEDRPDTSEVFKPYSYQNRLLNTMVIPANSEIALQSAKINKNGLALLNRANSNFNHYFGPKVGTTLCPDISHSTQTPFPGVIGKGELFGAGGTAERNVDDLANDIQSGLNAVAFNPVLIESSQPKNIVVDVEVDANKAFEGFKYEVTQNSRNTKYVAATLPWTDISVNKSHTFTQALGVATSTSGKGFHLQNKNYPISQGQGSVTISFDDMNGSGATRQPWVIGLGRINDRFDINDNTYEYPQYCNLTSYKADAKAPQVAGMPIYSDISIGRSGENLCVWQSGVDSSARLSGTKMNEVVYWGAQNANFPGPDRYNLKTNNSNGKYTKVKFTLDNEHMTIDLLTADDTPTLLVDFIKSKANGGTKNNLLAPICAPKMAMYPIVACGKTGKTASIIQLFSYENYPSWEQSKYTNYDFWGYSQQNKLTRWSMEVEKRFWNDFGDTTSGALGDGTIVPLLTDDGEVLLSYESKIITSPSIEYGLDITNLASTGRTLGFFNNPVTTPLTDVDGFQTTISTSVPKLVSDTSLFIRLNNFTQNTINARQGTISKIIAHLPRFDNSGNDQGGLYFEPNEKTYLSLNNPEEIRINSFDLDIVYDNEVLCTALSGKTIIALHIRKALF